MSDYKWKVRGRDGNIIAYTTYKYEAEEVAAEDGGTVHRHVAKKKKAAPKRTPFTAYMEEAEYDDPFASQYARNPKKKTKAQSIREKKQELALLWEKQAPTVRSIDRARYTELAGLEGPFQLRSGKVVYYDAREGKYYDRDSDLYLEVDEYEAHTRARKPNPKLKWSKSDHGLQTARDSSPWRNVEYTVYPEQELGERRYWVLEILNNNGPFYRQTHSTQTKAKAAAQGSADYWNPPKKKRNPDDKWAQAVDEEIEERGTEGAFTAQARKAGYSNTMEFARKVMAGWRDGSKTVYNKKTRKQQKITKKTMYRANFAINVQKRNPTQLDGPLGIKESLLHHYYSALDSTRKSDRTKPWNYVNGVLRDHVEDGEITKAQAGEVVGYIVEAAQGESDFVPYYGTGSGSRAGFQPPKSNPADSVKNEDFYRGALSGATEEGAAPPGKTASSAYRKGYTYGAKLAKSSPEQVAKAVGYFHATGDVSGAGRYLVEETEEVVSRERNPAGWTKAKTEPSSASLQGPFVASGSIGPVKAGSKFYYSPLEKAFYDPVTKRYFSVKPPKVEVKKSEKRIARDKLEEAATTTQLELNAYRRALQMEQRALGRTSRQIEEAVRRDPQVAEFDKELKGLDKEISKLKPRQAAAFKPKKRKPGTVVRGTVVPGYESVVLEYQPGAGKIYATFDAQSPSAPIVRDMLRKYTPDTPAARGAYGYWQIGLDDLPALQLALAASERLTEVWRSDIGTLPSPNDRLQDEIKKIDSKARRAKRKKLIHAPDKPPRPGIDTYTGKKVEFQDEGIRFLMSRARAVLADDMGLGKTYQAIVAAQTAVPKGEQVLILCPAAVLGNWQADIQDFVPGVPVSVVTSTARYGGDKADPKLVDPGNYALKRDGDPPRDAHKLRFIIASYQGAASRAGDALLRKWLLSYGRDGHKKFGLIICDEAHRLKKHKTLGHRFVANLDTKRLWMLTGTPIANRPYPDLFGLVKLGQHPLGDNEEKFREEFTLERRKGGVVADPEMLPRLGNLLSGFVLRRTKADVLKKKLPEKVGGLQKALDPSKREGVIRAPMPKDFLFGPSKSRGQTEKLRRQLAIAKAPVTWDVALRAADAGKKVVLFSTYTAVLDEFGKLAEDEGLLYVEVRGSTSLLGKKVAVAMLQGDTLNGEEEEYARGHFGDWYVDLVYKKPYDEWDKDSLKAATKRFGKDRSQWPRMVSIFLGQMVAASEGVTLTQADTLLFNDLDYMPSRHLQAEDRIYRLSKKGAPPHKSVYIGYVLADSPLDQYLAALLFEKSGEIDDVYGGISSEPEKVAQRIRKEYLEQLKDAQRSYKAGRKRKRKRKGRRRNPMGGIEL